MHIAWAIGFCKVGLCVCLCDRRPLGRIDDSLIFDFLPKPNVCGTYAHEHKGNNSDNNHGSFFFISDILQGNRLGRSFAEDSSMLCELLYLQTGP